VPLVLVLVLELFISDAPFYVNLDSLPNVVGRLTNALQLG
jgi:hypothetical protein